VRIDLVFPRFKLLSGAERLILGLATALQQAGHEPRIVCHQFDDSCRPRLSPGVELVCSGKRLDWFRNRYLNAIADYGRTWQLDNLLDPNADARVLFGPALPLAARRRGKRPPTLYFCYEPPRALYQDRDVVLERLGAMRFLLGPLMTLYRTVDKRLVAAVDGVCTNSDFSAERIRACYGRAAPVITHGVDRERFDSAQPVATERPPALLTVNYLHPRKRVDLAIEAMALLVRDERDDGPTLPDDLRLHVIGDGPEREQLGALAEALGVTDRVEFLGFVADDDLPSHYWAALAYVHTTKDESLGLSVIEAAYCARPIVAVNEGGVTRTVHDEHTGYLVEPSAAGIAAGLRRLLALPDRGVHMGEQGRQRVHRPHRSQIPTEEIGHGTGQTTAGTGRSGARPHDADARGASGLFGNRPEAQADRRQRRYDRDEHRVPQQRPAGPGCPP
jgi:glycosyltransferase involved in cell wall biosynthesis